MKPTRIFSFLFISLLATASSLRAQIALENFSSFQSATTFFFGEWSSSGDPFVGDPTPVATFSQGTGFYNLASGTNADSSFVERSFASSINLGSNDFLSLSLRLLGDNTADSLTVFLIDAGFRTAFATFQSSAFNAATFTEQSVMFTADTGFSLAEVTSFRIGGNDPFASGVLSVALDNLSATSSGIGAVPEPSTYGLMGAFVLLALVYARRAKSASAKS